MSAAGAAGSEVPLHLRSIEYRAFEAAEGLTIVGRLRDSRPWAAGGTAVERVHDMELTVSVRQPDLTITEADAVMHTFPHTECPGIVAAFRGLAGVRVGRGYTRQVQERFGGPRGCTHLEHLARSLGPVVVQAVTSRRAREVAAGEAVDLLGGTGSPWARNSCHIWAEDGVAERKLEAGWHPGVGPYPAPPLASFLPAVDDGPD